MADAHVLVLEDDPMWQRDVSEVLQPIAASIHTAGALVEAESLLQTCYFNVAIVDWSLVLGNARDDQGAQFMQMLRTYDLTDTVRLIVLSAYPSNERMRASFREFKVVDFLEKRSFDADVLLQTALDALAQNHLDHDLEIEIEGDNGDLRRLWEDFTWARREPSEPLAAELYDLLRRVLPDATRLFIQKMQAGQSGAGVLRVQPYFDAQAGVPVVVKFGKKDKIRQEHTNFHQHIENFLGPYAGVQLTCELGRVLGVIRYQFIGAELPDVSDFARFYRRHAAEPIRHTLDNLFSVTCARWYGNQEMPRQRRDLVEMYTEGLRIDWAEVWRGVQQLGIDPESAQLTFAGVAGALPNPKRWLAQRDNRLYFTVVRTVTHGDLNEHNILVTEDERTWLIDFYRTGWSHILRDAVVLETAIKFNLAENKDINVFHDLDAVLLRQTRLDHLRIPTGHAQSKVLTVLAHLRHLAANLNGVNHNMAEYNASLLLATLNLLRFDFMREHHPLALLSAAHLCQWLENGTQP
jgi:CheY-like chemotaxis protein